MQNDVFEKWDISRTPKTTLPPFRMKTSVLDLNKHISSEVGNLYISGSLLLN